MRKSKKDIDYDGPKILIFDIETSPVLTYIWNLRQKYIPIEMISENLFVLCWAAKWAHSKTIYKSKLPDFKEAYSNDKKDDRLLLEGLWELLDEADMIVAHNAKGFDVPMVNGRFLYHGMQPPSTYKVIDTLQIVRREFRLTSNKLDYVSEYLGYGRKHKTDFELWLGCMSGNKKAWNQMMGYNVRDVSLLEKVYLKVRAWDTRHPNFGLYVSDADPRCLACGSKNLIKKGTEKTLTQIYRRLKCKDCGHNNRGRFTILEKEKRKTLLTNSV